jgi:hypothetical protein
VLIQTRADRLLACAAVERDRLAYLAVRKGNLAHPTRFERVTFAFGGQTLLKPVPRNRTPRRPTKLCLMPQGDTEELYQ